MTGIPEARLSFMTEPHGDPIPSPTNWNETRKHKADIKDCLTKIVYYLKHS